MLVFGSSQKILLVIILCVTLSHAINNKVIFSVYLNSLEQFIEKAKSLLRERLRLTELTLKDSIPHVKRTILNPGRYETDLRLLESVEIGPKIPASAVISGVAFVKTSRRSYLIGAGKRNFDGSMRNVMSPVWMWDDANFQYQLLHNIPTPGAIGVEGFVINDEAYFILTINPGKNLLDYEKRKSELYKIDRNEEIVSIQNFTTTAATKWKSFVSDGQIYLMQASVLRWKRLSKLHRDYAKSIAPKVSSEVKLYKWIGVGFTKVANLKASQTTSVDTAVFMGKTFLAVVDQKFDETNMKSTILIYEMSEGDVKLMQKVHGWFASDIRFVVAQNQLYLAIAYNFRVIRKQMIHRLDSIILKFNGLIFVKYQNIPTDCALMWTTLASPTGQDILHLQSSEAPDQMFQFLEGTWTKMSTHLVMNAGDKLGIANLVHQEGNAVAIPINRYVRFFELKFVTESSSDLRSAALQKCSRLIEKVKVFAKKRQDHEKSGKRLASLTRRQEWSGVKHFKEVEIRNLKLQKMVVKNTKVYKRVLVERMGEINQMLLQLPHDLSRYLKKSGSQTITEPVVVDKVHIDSLTTTKIDLNLVHDAPFCSFLSNVIRLTGPQPLDTTRRHVIFDHVVYQNDLTLHGTLNSVNIPSDVVFLDRPNVFNATKTFRHGISATKNIKILETINRFRPEHILLTRDHQIIQTETHIHSDVVALSISVAGHVKIAGVPWSWFINEAVRIDEAATIKGTTTMNEMIVMGDLDPKGSVNKIDVERMFSNAIPLNRDVKFTHPVSFVDARFENNLYIVGKLNGVVVPTDLVLLEKSPWNLDLEINRDLGLRKVDVTGLINGVRVDRRSVMTRSGNQVVFGEKTFENIRMESNLIVSGLINGFNLTEIIGKTKSDAIHARNTYERLTVHSLNVIGKLPTDLHRLFYETVKTNEDHKFSGHVTFTKPTHFRENLDLPPVVFQHLVPVRKNQKIYLRSKVFHNVVFEDDVTIKGTVNNLDVNDVLNNILTITGNQTITAPKIFANIRVDSDSFVRKRINNVKLEDAVRIDKHVNLRSEISFDETLVVHEKSIIEKTVVKSKLNGLPANEWFEDTLLRSKEQEIRGNKTFLGVLNVGRSQTEFKNIQVVGDVYLHNANLKEFRKDVVLVDERSEIYSKTIFDVDVRIEDIETTIVDNVNIVDLFTHSLKIDENRCVEINSEVTIQNLQTKQINEIDASVMKNVLTTNDRDLPGNLHFHHLIVRDIKLTGLVNGLKFRIDAVTSTEKNVIDMRGPKIFENVKIGKLELSGAINGIDLIHLNENVVKQGVEQKIRGVIKVDNVHFKDNVTVKGLIAGRNLTEFVSQTWLIDEDVVIKSTVMFHDVLYNPKKSIDLRITGLLDEVNLIAINQSLMTTEGYQEIRTPLLFKNTVIMNNVKIRHNLDLADKSYVNGVHLPQWEKKIVKINKNEIIIAPQTFANAVKFNDLKIIGTMNDIKLDDVMRKDVKMQEIHNVKVFNEIIVKNLEVKGLIMGVDVQHWQEESFFIDDRKDFVFTNDAQFESLILEEDSIFESTINEIDLSSIVTVNGHQVIIAPKVFTNTVKTPRWIHSLKVTGTLNSMTTPFPLFVDELFKSPLPYPCRGNYVYFMYGCYRIYPRNYAVCDFPASKLERFSEPEKEMLRRMRLFELFYGWFIPETGQFVTICYYTANLRITDEMTMIGNFMFTNRSFVIDGIHRTVFETPLQKEFGKIIGEYELVKNEMQVATDNLQLVERRMCLKLNTYDNVLRNAYRPLSPFYVVQTIDVDPKRIVPLDLEMTNGVMSFLVVENHQISFYVWKQYKFEEIQNIEFIDGKNWLRLELNSHQDKANGIVTLFLAHSHGCKENEINSIEIVTLSLEYQWLAVNLKDASSIYLNCTRRNNVQSTVIRGEIYLISGTKHEIIVWKKHETKPIAWMNNLFERYEIYYVTVIDSSGMFAVASRYNGMSLISVYNLNVLQRRIEKKFVIQNLPKIRHISAVVERTKYYVTFLTKSQIHLAKFIPSSNDIETIQTLNVDCPKDLFWVKLRNEKRLFVGSCGCSTHVFSFTGYLNHLYKSQRGFVPSSQVFETQNEVFLTMQLRDCFQKTYKIAVLRAERKGPILKNQCPLPCTDTIIIN